MRKSILTLCLIITGSVFSCDKEISYYQCITDKNAGDALKAFTVRIDDAARLKYPGLIILARGVGDGEEFVAVNGKRYAIPAIPGASSAGTGEESNDSGKAGWYRSTSDDELLAKIIIPLPDVELLSGINHIVFSQQAQTDGFLVSDARITSVQEKEARIAQLTYRVIIRGDDPKIDDYDFVVNYSGESKRKSSDLPEWAQRGKVRYYRAGIDFDNLDRMFEMFKEGHFNLVMLQVATLAAPRLELLA